MIKEIPVSAVYPVRPTYTGDTSISLGASGMSFSADDGFKFYESTISNQLTDVKMNRDTILQLLKKNDVSEILVDSVKDTGLVGNYTIFSTTRLTPTAYEYAFCVNSSGILSATVDTSNENIRFFTLTTSADKIQIRYKDKAWTYSPSLSTLTLSEYSGLTSQQFDITHVVDGYHTISQNGSPLTISANSTALSCFGFSTKGSVYDINETQLLEISADGLTAKNRFVLYENIYKPEFSSTKTTLTPLGAPIEGVPLNYVINAPYYNIEMPSGENIEAKLPFDIIPLKNFKTINSDQIFSSYLEWLWWDRYDHSIYTISNSGDEQNVIWNDDNLWSDFAGQEITETDLLKINYREYEKIYSGASQSDGHSEIHLGFSSQFGTIIKLHPDKYTFFHIPEIAVQQKLEDVVFESVGAVAGTSPAQSDRIYKKLGTYNNNIWWGGDNTQINDGTWLCAWLCASGNDAIWLERYYNPGKMTYSAAMESSGALSGQFTQTSGAYYWDMESSMTLTPGSYYKYFHIGKSTFEAQLSEVITPENTVLKLENFVQDSSVVNDSSQNNNDGIISNPEKAIVTELQLSFIPTLTPAIILNSISEITIPNSTSFDTPDHRTTLTWVYMDDWNNDYKKNYSGAIYSNYYNGGDKLEYIDHGIYYSSIIPNATSATSGNKIAIVYNNISSTSGGNIISTTNKRLPSQISGLCMAVDLDGHLWACGNMSGISHIYRFAPDGTCVLNGEFTGIINKFGIKDDNTGFIKDNSAQKLYEIDLNTLNITSTTTSVTGTPYLSTNGTLSTHSLVDYIDMFSDGKLCTLSGTELRYDNNIINSSTLPESGMTFDHVCCDDSNYIYTTTHNTSSDYYIYRKAKSTSVTSWEECSSLSLSANPQSPIINRVFISKQKINNMIENVINWIRPDGSLQKIYLQSGVWEQISLNPLLWDGTQIVYDGDFSGYKLNKVHNLLNGSKPILKYSTLLLSGENPVKYSTTFSSSGLSNNWHHFVTVKGESDISLYIDGKLVSQEPIPSGSELKYYSGSAYVVGADVVDNAAITTLMSENIGKFSGGISEHTVVDAELSESSISTAYDIKYLSNIPISWVVKTQSRNFVENIKSLYKFRLPGMKSQFYNIIIRNSNIAIEDRAEYESLIRQRASENSPDYIKLKGIIWK